MRVQYLTAKASSPSSTAWLPIDWFRNPIALGLSVSDPSAAGWALSVTIDDPTGTNPNPQLNPAYPTLSHGSSGANVQTFGSSQVAGWGGQNVTVVNSTAATPVPSYFFEFGFCFGAGTGAAVGAITQPIAGLQLTSTANLVAGNVSSGIPTLTILQAGPR